MEWPTVLKNTYPFEIDSFYFTIHNTGWRC